MSTKGNAFRKMTDGAYDALHKVGAQNGARFRRSLRGRIEKRRFGRLMNRIRNRLRGRFRRRNRPKIVVPKIVIPTCPSFALVGYTGPRPKPWITEVRLLG